MPDLLAGPGTAVRGDARALVGSPALPDVDLAYLDPPYNQHRYDSNYHVWETLVAWDAPDHYGVACKRADLRDPATRSAFNGRRTMAPALAEVVDRVAAEVVVLSYNNESWLSLRGAPRTVCRLGVTSRCWPSTRPATWAPASGSTTRRAARSGTVSHLRNTEYVVLAGPRSPGPGHGGSGRRGRTGCPGGPPGAGHRRLTGHPACPRPA